MWLVTSILLTSLATLAYLWTKKKFSYWRSRGFPEEPGYFPMGSRSTWKVVAAKISFVEMLTPCYDGFKGQKCVGYYSFMGQPTLVIRDMELVKKIMVKDFEYFVDRRPNQLDKTANKYLANMLTSLKGEKWKAMRSMISPIFTSGKLKHMAPLVNKVGEDMVNHLKSFAMEGKEFDAKLMMTSFSLDVIATTGFGVEANSFSNPDNPFRDNVEKLNRQGKYKPTRLQFFKGFLLFVVPFLGRLFKMPAVDKEALEFLADIVRSQIKSRKASGKKRNDFIDTLIAALDSNVENIATDNTKEEEDGDEDQFDKDAKLQKDVVGKMGFTKEEFETVVISNALLLFFAGFATVSSSLTWILYFIGADQRVQDRLYDEMKEAIEENGGDTNLSFKKIQELHYLDMCVLEGLRLSRSAFLERQCVKEFKIPGTNLVIEKGVMVQLPGPNIHVDPKYFGSNPETFQPENFSNEAKLERGPYPFLSFGHGPRNCVGMRFALLELKVAVIKLIWNYKLVVSREMHGLEFEKTGFNPLPQGGLWLKVENRCQT